MTNFPNTTAECGERCQCDESPGEPNKKPLNSRGYCEYYCIHYNIQNAYCGMNNIPLDNGKYFPNGDNCTGCETGSVKYFKANIYIYIYTFLFPMMAISIIR